MLRTCKECESTYGDHTAVRFCPACGSTVHATSGEIAVLSECESGATATNTKSPVLAALLSFLMVGMGQVYIGQVEKGLTMLGVVLLLIVTVVLGPLGLLILLFNVVDAFVLARIVNQGRPIRKWQFFFQSR